jgi:SAM-dependent methyltransferase
MKPWQIQLFEKSLMKKEKVRKISKLMNFSNKKVFDLGCSNGTVSYFLGKSGGDWIHCDLDYDNLITAKEILKNNFFQTPENTIPVKDNQFDTVLALDYLEHIDDDDNILKEIHRILNPNGKVVISTPITGRFFLLNKLKDMVGLTPEIYGHKREGYSLKKLKELLKKNGFSITHSSTYAKFFVEFFEIFLNVLYTKKNKPPGEDTALRSGSISPSSAKDMNKNKTLFKIYANFVYPIIYLITKLDTLLWFKTGYATLVIAEKE